MSQESKKVTVEVELTPEGVERPRELVGARLIGPGIVIGKVLRGDRSGALYFYERSGDGAPVAAKVLKGEKFVVRMEVEAPEGLEERARNELGVVAKQVRDRPAGELSVEDLLALALYKLGGTRLGD